MDKASPVDLRKALDMVMALHKAGILFVPMPVEDSEEFKVVAERAWDMLEAMEKKRRIPSENKIN